MKLRIRDNSIRLRLTQPEVAGILADGLVRGRVAFAGGTTFDYLLESSPATVKPEAHLSNNVLTVRIPVLDIRRWAESDQVGIASSQSLDEGGSLDILVEKDFACLAPRPGEDDSDMYPNPAAATDSC